MRSILVRLRSPSFAEHHLDSFWQQRVGGFLSVFRFVLRVRVDACFNVIAKFCFLSA